MEEGAYEVKMAPAYGLEGMIMSTCGALLSARADSLAAH
jgi:hypothetical protein